MSLLRAGVHVKTAPPAPVGPWSCVWRNRDGLRCHVGRVYDAELISGNATEYSQSQFPRKKPSTMTLIGGAVVTIAPDTNMSQASTSGFKTGSSKVYYKTNFGRASYDDNDLVEVPDSGYAFWPEGKYKSQGGGVYVILSRLEKTSVGNEPPNPPKWVLSLSLEANVQKRDFKIACVAGTSCIQIWQSDIVYSKEIESDYPFKVKLDGNKIIVVAGGINSIRCEASGTYGNGTWFVVGSATFNGQYGNVGSADVTIQSSMPSSSDLTGVILIATVTIGTTTSEIDQIVSGSQFVDRFKCSNVGTAQYFWNLV